MNSRDFRVHVKHLREDVYDIFWGLGWDNWSRVQIVIKPEQKPKFLPVSGFSLPFYARIATSKYLRLPT